MGGAFSVPFILSCQKSNAFFFFFFLFCFVLFCFVLFLTCGILYTSEETLSTAGKQKERPEETQNCPPRFLQQSWSNYKIPCQFEKASAKYLYCIPLPNVSSCFCCCLFVWFLFSAALFFLSGEAGGGGVVIYCLKFVIKGVPGCSGPAPDSTDTQTYM